jgi:hypothetical protein
MYDVCRLAPARVRGELENRRVHIAACGNKHSIVATDAGDVFVFGDNAYAQLGLARTDLPVSNPEFVGSAVCIGPRFAEVLQASRRCNVPANLPIPGAFFSAVCAGDKFSVAVDSKGGSIWAWGSYESSFCPSPLDHEKLKHHVLEHKDDPSSAMSSILSTCRQAAVLPTPFAAISRDMYFGDISICASASTMVVLSPENALEISTIFPLLMVTNDAPTDALPPLEHDAVCLRGSAMAFVRSCASVTVAQCSEEEIETLPKIHADGQFEPSMTTTTLVSETQASTQVDPNLGSADPKNLLPPNHCDEEHYIIQPESPIQPDLQNAPNEVVIEPIHTVNIQPARTGEQPEALKANVAAVETSPTVLAVPVAAAPTQLSWWQRCLCC